MPDEIKTQDEQDEAALEQMESTLTEMRGDDSWNDTDNPGDELVLDEETNDPAQETGEGSQAAAEQEGEGDEAEAGGDPAVDAKPEGGDGEAAGDAPVDPAPGLTPEEQDKADDDLMATFDNEKSSARFQELRNQAKTAQEEYADLDARHTELDGAASTLFGYLDESQTQPEQLSAALSINKAINTGDFSQVAPAFERMRQMMDQVAVGLGIPLRNMDLPQDLQTAVDNLETTPELARETMALRARQNQEQHYQNQGAQVTQQATDNTAAKQQAAADIKAWEQGLIKSDPDFTGKQKQMLEGAKQIMATVPPAQWLASLQDEYRIITNTQTRIAGQQQRERVRQPSPLRPGGMGGGSQPSGKPANFEENFDLTLRNMRANAE